MDTRIQLQLHAIEKKCNVKVFLLVVVHSIGTNCVYVFFFATCVIYLYRENRCRHSMSNLDIRSQIADETNISQFINRRNLGFFPGLLWRPAGTVLIHFLTLKLMTFVIYVTLDVYLRKSFFFFSFYVLNWNVISVQSMTKNHVFIGKYKAYLLFCWFFIQNFLSRE